MFIANELRKTNIAEYLLYMWQVEDTIRAYGCSLPRIRREYITRFDFTDEQRDEETDWFGNLVRMMNEEGCREGGHLQINRVTLQMLDDLHRQLLSSPKFPFYSAAYYKVLPFIVELRQKSKAKPAQGDLQSVQGDLQSVQGDLQSPPSEIETCLNLLYGVMLLRLQKKELTPNTGHAVREVSNFIGMLADYYKKDKEEPLQFET